MMLPDTFTFTQTVLQDFVECPRRFFLRHVRHLAWPAVEAEPVEERERRLQLGQTFHRLVQQHLVGIPEARLTPIAEGDPELAAWWRNYLTYRPATSLLAGGGGEVVDVRPELVLSAPLEGHRLMAKYDLVVVHRPGDDAPARLTIFDWKTGGRRMSTARLRSRMQTRVYRYLLVRAGAYLTGGPGLSPAQVEMVYWFAAYPDAPERLPYGAEAYRADEAYLRRLVAQIAAMPDDAFGPTDDDRRCAYCHYRSYCDRGREAGPLDALDEPPQAGDDLAQLDLDFEQIAEIAF